MQTYAFERRLTPCAEFPNDNQALHHGATWICAELGHAPTFEVPRPRLPASGPAELPDDGFAHAIDVGDFPDTHPPSDDLDTEPPGEDLDTEPSGDPLVSKLTIDPPCDAPIDPAGDTIVSKLTIAPSAGRQDTELPESDVDASLLGDDSEPIEIVEELSFDDAVDSGLADASEPSAERSPADAFVQLVSSLEEVARALGAGNEGIACLAALFGQTRFDGIAPGERATEALLAGGVIIESTRGFTRSNPFTAKVLAWQGILRGESEDFSLSDGGALEPLDEWAADVVARVLGPPARADGIRQELRRRGIAAFGIVAEAA